MAVFSPTDNINLSLFANLVAIFFNLFASLISILMLSVLPLINFFILSSSFFSFSLIFSFSFSILMFIASTAFSSAFLILVSLFLTLPSVFGNFFKIPSIRFNLYSVLRRCMLCLDKVLSALKFIFRIVVIYIYTTIFLFILFS